jgi:TetR/AcrR family transcriptional regulator, ethionamide resistance regulator
MIPPVSTPAQRTRHRRQREGTRREILTAADRFLRERPYRELTIEVVMAQTDLTRTAFYRHFDDVTDLVLQLLGDLGSELATVAERWGATAGSDTPAPAREGLTEIVDFFIRHGPLVRAVAEAAVTDEQIERGYRGSLEALIEITAGALQRLAESGRLQVPDTRALARALNLMNEAYLLQEFGREPFGDREVALATLELVWLRVVGPS